MLSMMVVLFRYVGDTKKTTRLGFMINDISREQLVTVFKIEGKEYLEYKVMYYETKP